MNPDSQNPEITDADIRSQATISIVEPSPDDWAALRDLKLKSLEQEPIAFEDVEQGKEKYTARAEEEWREILSGHMSGGRAGEVLNMFAKDESDNKYAGMVSAIIPENSKVATVQHMYVDKEGYRGQGIGKQLLQALIEKIRSKGNVEKIELQVVATQEAAIGLYISLGFKEVGKVEGGVQRGDEHYEEIEMELILE